MSSRSIASATSYASSIVYGAIVAKLCSRSHGQPCSGSRNRAIIASRRSMGRVVMPLHRVAEGMPGACTPRPSVCRIIYIMENDASPYSWIAGIAARSSDPAARSPDRHNRARPRRAIRRTVRDNRGSGPYGSELRGAAGRDQSRPASSARWLCVGCGSRRMQSTIQISTPASAANAFSSSSVTSVE